MTTARKEGQEKLSGRRSSLGVWGLRLVSVGACVYLQSAGFGLKTDSSCLCRAGCVPSYLGAWMTRERSGLGPLGILHWIPNGTWLMASFRLWACKAHE